MIENWRIWVIGILMTLSIIDLGLTGYYVYKYKTWQPEKPYNLIELNPLLHFLWNNLGFWVGHFVGSVIILTLIYLVGKSAHPIIVGLLGVFLLGAMFNHYTNINLLHKLIEKYPSGHLPRETFGKVIGNN
jgi:hypothetical protein